MTDSIGWNAVLGALAGAAWNLANFWMLTRLLSAWMNPVRSRRRVFGWLLLKLAVLYPMACMFLRAFPQLAVSFGVGFTLVLCAAVAWFAASAQLTITLKTHGR